MTFRSGGKVVHDLPPVTGMRERIGIFFGRELAESLLWVEGRLDQLHLWGYVAHPSQSRSSTKGQFLFLGGRYVRDRSLGHALGEAYRGLLMVGRNPVAFLHLEMPPEDVDVNVHPTKIEVRFRDPQRVYSHLLSTLRQTFLASDLHSRLQAAQEQPAQAPFAARTAVFLSKPAGNGLAPTRRARPGRHGRVVRAFGPGPRPAGGCRLVRARLVRGNSLDPGFGRPGRAARVVEDVARPVRIRDGRRVRRVLRPSRRCCTRCDTSSERVRPAGAAVPADVVPAAPGMRLEAGLGAGALKAIQVHDSYLIAETRDGMMVIDQHALHERILYEELRVRVAGGKVESQGLLVPDPIHLAADEAAAILDQRELLAELGLEVEPFGGDTIWSGACP